MAKKKWSEEERHDLIRKLNADLEDFLEECAKKPKSSIFTEFDNLTIDEIWEKMKQHPAFMTEFDPSQPISPEMQGLIDLKYNTDDAEEKADSYREDGNNNFKKRKYRWAIDSYSEGIKAKCANKELNAILYSNRAACHYHIENYRSSLNDCVFARKFKPDHIKAIIRGAQCCVQIKRYDQGIKWCDSALLIDPENSVVMELRSKAEKLKRTQERDRRKEAMKEKKQLAEENKLIESIQKRGINIGGLKKGEKTDKLDTLSMSSLENHQNPAGAKVHLDEEGILHWPVLFLYPEYQETDFVKDFNENDIFADHIDQMFGSSVEPPTWDVEQKYKPQKLQLYFEDREKEKLVEIKKDSTLLQVLQDKRYVVHGGTPGIICVVKDSPFCKQFLKKYDQL